MEQDLIEIRVGGRYYDVQGAEGVYRFYSGDLDIWLAEFQDPSRALNGISIKNHWYTGRGALKDDRRFIWLFFCNLPGNMNACCGLWSYDKFLISVNVDTDIVIEPDIYDKAMWWEELVSRPEVKRSVKSATEKLIDAIDIMVRGLSL